MALIQFLRKVGLVLKGQERSLIDGAGELKSLAVIQGTVLGLWLIQMETGLSNGRD